jgi:hypothetical protein
MEKSPSKKTGKNIVRSCCDEATDKCSPHFSSSDSNISEGDVSIALLKELLGTYKIEALIDEDGELEVSEAFGPAVYIRLDPSRHWIVFHTGFSTLVLDSEERMKFADYLNSNLSMAQFVAMDSGIGMGYFMYYRGGLNVDQFMALAQRFGSLAFTAVKRLTTFVTRSESSEVELRTVDVLN